MTGHFVAQRTIPKQRSDYRRGPYSRAANRLREIERIIKDRHGKVPDTDDADIYLVPIARCYRRILHDRGKLVSVDHLMQRFGFWLKTWAPHVTDGQAADIVRSALAKPPRLDADDRLGASLRLSYADRHRLNIRTIGSYNVDRKSRRKLAKDRRRERDRQRAAAKRKANGMKPRTEYEARSLSKTKPWEQLGISRRTWERRRKEGLTFDASVSPHPFLYPGATDLRHVGDKAREVLR
jgi:hypothetical protein